MKKVLLTSVCRPLGPAQGDAPSVGYELLHGQITRAQGMFSPRSLHLHFSLEYVAENLEAPCTVLQYPSRRELIRELKKGYDYVGISFLLALFHRMKDVVAMVREHAPNTEIVLGGYGAVLTDEELAPYADHICREEGVGFMRRLLGEAPIVGTMSHPLVVSRLKVFGANVSKTGMIFAGLGCPNGCDFCCTSHFFKRKHIKLLPTGQDIYNVAERYLELDPDITMVVLDEDFLLNRERAYQFREAVIAGGKALSIFAFASIKAISQYDISELVEMGIDGLWIGYEGTRSGYAKQEGRAPEELFPELRRHGISILASMIVGLPYQDEATVRAEREGLFALKPDLSQFLIYGPTPGTPFYQRVIEENRLREEFVRDRERYYKSCDGFAAMVEHPKLTGDAIESLQRESYDEDFQRLGPSIYRSVETWMLGWRTLRDSANPMLRRKADRFAKDLRHAYPVFLAGRLFGPNRLVRRWVAEMQQEVHEALGRPTVSERIQSVAAAGLALWSAFTLKLDLLQHPRLVRNEYRVPAEAPAPARIWRRLGRSEHPVSVELRPEGVILLRLSGDLGHVDSAQFANRVRRALARTKNRLVLDLKPLTQFDRDAAERMADALRDYRDRIRILAPATFGKPGVAAALAVFTMHSGPGFGF